MNHQQLAEQLCEAHDRLYSIRIPRPPWWRRLWAWLAEELR